jgi:hypothetical protein
MLLHQGKIERQKRIPADPLPHTREREREREELLTPIMATLGFLVVLATAAVFTEDGVTRFFLTTVTKSQSEGFSHVTMDGSGSEFLAGAVITATLGLPPSARTTSLYDLVAAPFAVADESASRRVDGT